MKMRCIVLEMGIAPFFVRSAYVRDMLTFMKLFDKNLSGIYNRFNKNGPYEAREDFLTRMRQEVLPDPGAWEGNCGT